MRISAAAQAPIWGNLGERAGKRSPSAGPEPHANSNSSVQTSIHSGNLGRLNRSGRPRQGNRMQSLSRLDCAACKQPASSVRFVAPTNGLRPSSQICTGPVRLAAGPCKELTAWDLPTTPRLQRDLAAHSTVVGDVVFFRGRRPATSPQCPSRSSCSAGGGGSSAAGR